MKMKIVDRMTTELEVDVKFPIYRRNVGGTDYSMVEYFMRVDLVNGKMQEFTITVRDGHHVEIEVDDDYKFDGSGLNYSLGLGEYASDEEEFMEALLGAEILIKNMKVTVVK
jgi:hypothetical protein